MITLKEACEKVLAAHPNEYIWVVNEYEKAYQFDLMNNGEEVGPYTCFCDTTGVMKEDGSIDETLTVIDPIFKGEHKHYSHDYIENLLREPSSSRA